MQEPARIELAVPFPIATANAWLVAGGQPLLVDCGAAGEASYAALVAGLHANGVGDVARLRLAVTHGHVDHAGNAARLRREHGVPLLAAAGETSLVESFRRDEGPRNDAFMAAAIAHGMPRELAAKLRSRSHEVDAHMEDAPIAHTLADGQRIPAGDGDVTVRFAPGHTEGSILLDDGEGRLFTGDTLLQHITSNAIELLDEDKGRYHRYLRTLDGLRRFNGCTAYPGHFAAFPITDALIDEHLGKHRRRSARLLEHLDAPRSAWELIPKVLPHLAKGQTFLAMCEVVGHLHALEVDGALASSTVEGVRRFRRT